VTVQAGINRYLSLPPVNLQIDIYNGVQFAASNRMVTTVARMYIKTGGKTKHYCECRLFFNGCSLTNVTINLHQLADDQNFDH
jgi:hypothetical protein